MKSKDSLRLFYFCRHTRKIRRRTLFCFSRDKQCSAEVNMAGFIAPVSKLSSSSFFLTFSCTQSLKSELLQSMLSQFCEIWVQLQHENINNQVFAVQIAISNQHNESSHSIFGNIRIPARVSKPCTLQSEYQDSNFYHLVQFLGT